MESFFVGVAAGAAIMRGFSILKWGTKRSLAHRKERKELTELNEKLERVEAERRDDDDTERPRHRLTGLRAGAGPCGLRDSTRTSPPRHPRSGHRHRRP